MTDTSALVTVGRYLAIRLQQLGIAHVFGVPGDFNLALLDEVLVDGALNWVGAANELNAAYAADGYARVRRGPAVVMTTLGVGELSAINGIAGSYAEDVPVIQVTGTAPLAAIRSGALLHHTMADGDLGRFLRMYREVTASAEMIEPDTAGERIDAALLVAIRQSKPVYLAIPADVAVTRIDGSSLAEPLRVHLSDPEAVRRFEDALRQTITEDDAVTVLAGPRLHRFGLEDSIAQLGELDGVAIASQSGSKAILDESAPGSLGTYLGALSASVESRDAVDEATHLVLAGTVLSDLLTGFFSHRFDPAAAIELGVIDARVGGTRFYGVRLEDSFAALRRVLAARHDSSANPVSGRTALRVPEANSSGHSSLGVQRESTQRESTQRESTQRESMEPLTQEALWQLVNDWLPDGSLVVADAGTSFYGALGLRMPPKSDLMGQPVWSSIGYTLPAVLGAGLADPGRQVVLFIGDGSAQLTIQELGTILQRGLCPHIFLVNNGGYTVERVIQSPDACYQGISEWDWLQLPAALAPGVSVTLRRVRTAAELVRVFEELDATPGRPALIEVMMDRDDAPPLLRVIGDGLQAANKRD